MKGRKELSEKEKMLSKALKIVSEQLERLNCLVGLLLAQDCMTKLGFWKDDCQICSTYEEKRWTNTIPGIAISVEELK